MSVVVNSNVPSIHASRSLASNRLDLEKAMERLSSGKRLNSSRDDAAGMSVVTRMTSQIQGLNMAVRNANDGISMANTYDAAAEEGSAREGLSCSWSCLCSGWEIDGKDGNSRRASGHVQ